MFVYTTLKATTFQKGMDSAFVLALGLYNISIVLLLYNPPYKAWLDVYHKIYIFILCLHVFIRKRYSRFTGSGSAHSVRRIPYINYME